MAENILKLKVDSREYDSKIERARNGLLHLQQSLQEAGKTFKQADKDQVAFVQELGKMQTVSNTAKGKIGELSKAFVDLSVQYKHMTDQEKESPIGKAMSASLEQIKTRGQDAKKEIADFEQQLNGRAEATKVAGGFLSGDKMSGMLQVLGGNLMTKAVSMAGNLAMEMGQMVTQGIELAKQGEGIRIAFERLGRGDILKGLREATHGTVTDLELMKAAVKFNDFKLPVEELGTMLAFAQQKAKDTGQSVDYMVDSIVTGLGRKSLMILDNLGLSAAEIKEKMAQTGDMTKAVGEIIREQMSKAGNYIETAADKATAADVRLKNAMTDLGNTLQPLSSDFDNFWNELKIGGLNFLNDVLSPIVSKMTEAGQIASAKNRMGGSDTVNSQLNTLSGSNMKQVTMLSQLAQYDRQIKELQAASSNVIVPASGQGAQFALNQIKSYENQIKALQQMREEYRKAAMDIIAPKSVENTTSTPTTPSKVSTQKLKEEYIPLEGSIDAMTAKVKELQDAFNKTAEQSVRGKLLVEIQNVQKQLDFMKGSGLGLAKIDRESLTDKLGVNLDAKKMKDVIKIPESLAKSGEAVAESWSTAMSAVSGLGSALSGIQDPAVKVLGIIAEAIATIALTFAKSLKGTMTPWDWIAGAAAGTATMISTISAIKSATAGSFAEGGIVPGNSMSGDGLLARVNSQEMILNVAQQQNVAAALQQGAANRTIKVIGKISGRDILLSADRTGKTLGYGELMFGKNL